MPKRNSGEQKYAELTLLDLKKTWFHLNGKQINIEDATDQEFDQFIRNHIEVCWTLEDRRDALNLALKQQKTLEIQPEIEAIKIRGKTQYHLIFKAPEPALQGTSEQ